VPGRELSRARGRRPDQPWPARAVARGHTEAPVASWPRMLLRLWPYCRGPTRAVDLGGFESGLALQQGVSWRFAALVGCQKKNKKCMYVCMYVCMKPPLALGHLPRNEAAGHQIVTPGHPARARGRDVAPSLGISYLGVAGSPDRTRLHLWRQQDPKRGLYTVGRDLLDHVIRDASCDSGL
jgi:hypothetical protein